VAFDEKNEAPFLQSMRVFYDCHLSKVRLEHFALGTNVFFVLKKSGYDGGAGSGLCFKTIG
jgi:hypothetical protein